MKKSELFQDVYLTLRRILCSQDEVLNKRLREILLDDYKSTNDKINESIFMYNEYISISHTAALAELLSHYIKVDNDIDFCDKDRLNLVIKDTLDNFHP